MALPEPGDPNWGEPLNDYILGVEDKADTALADLETKVDEGEAVSTSGNSHIVLPDDNATQALVIEIPGNSDRSTAPDTVQFLVGTVGKTSWWNEYGEFRVSPSDPVRVPFKVRGLDNQSGDLAQFQQNFNTLSRVDANGNILAPNISVTKFLPSDMTLTGSALTRITDIDFDVDEGATYRMRWVLSYHSDGTAGARIRIGVDGPTASLVRWTSSHTFSSGSVNKSEISYGSYFADAEDASSRPLYLDAIVTITTQGVVSPEFSSPDGAPITVTAGSYGEAKRIA